jgi:hypothetical protein
MKYHKTPIPSKFSSHLPQSASFPSFYLELSSKTYPRHLFQFNSPPLINEISFSFNEVTITGKDIVTNVNNAKLSKTGRQLAGFGRGNSASPDSRLATSMSSLPKATSSTAYVDITLIETGTIDIPLWALHQDGPQDMTRIPVYCFLIEHGSLGKKVMFDLGVPKVFAPCKGGS